MQEESMAAVKSLQAIIAPTERLKTEKKEACQKWAAAYFDENPPKKLEAKVNAVLDEANKLVAPSKQAKAKATVVLKGKKSALDKALDKAQKKGKSGEKVIREKKAAPGPCPKKAGN